MKGLHGLSRSLATSRTLAGLTWRQRIAIVVFAFPVLTLLAAAGFGIEALVYHARSVAVDGTVVERYEWPGETFMDRGQINYEPIFTYRIGDEDYRASVGSAHASFDVPVGGTATIRAVPGERGNVRMDTFWGMWGMPAVLGALGAGALAVAAVIWLILSRLIWRRSA